MHLLEKRRADDALMSVEAEAIHALQDFAAEDNRSARQDTYDAEHERVVYDLGTARV
jgi:hypothetical protein